MALTRAQLLMGNFADGAILSGQPQGVRPGGAGIAIAADGTISIDSQSIVGVMKLGQTAGSAAAAYNGYTWPANPGTAGQQLTTNGAGILGWGDSDGIPWTAKGQLIAGTGVATDTLLNVGSNTAFLVADSTTASGLGWSDSSSSAALSPAGSTAQRPNPATPGQFRYNTSTGKFEFSTGGTSWEEITSGVPGPGGSTFVTQTIPAGPAGATGNALIPSGSTAQRQTAPAPVVGSTRYNTTTGKLEVYGGAGVWETLPSSTAGTFVGQTIPPAGKTASAIIPPGPTGQEETVGVTGGWMRYNTTANQLEFFNGTSWELVAPSGGGVSSFVQAGTPVASNTGDIWYDTVRARESVWDGASWVQPGVTQTDPAGAALLPTGPLGGRPGVPSNGMFRLSTTSGKLEIYTAGTWEQVASSNPATGTFVPQTVPTTGTASAVIPSGNTAGRQTVPAPVGGYIRFNIDTTLMEVFDGTIWTPVGAPPNAGLGLNLSGVTPNQILKATSPVAATPPAPGTLATQSIDGSMYWDSQYGSMFVRYNDGSNTQWVMINGNNIQTGTLTFPPGPAPGATYAAPNGLTYTYDGTKGVWTCPAGSQLGFGLATNGGFAKVSITAQTNAPAAGTGQAQAMDGSMYWDDTLGAMFIRYNNGGSPAWVQTTSSGGGGGLGIGQTWQDVTASRALGTTYTNSTGKPIFVSIYTTSNNTPATGATLSVDGINVQSNQGYAGPNGTGTNLSISTVVPAGSTYLLSGANFLAWAELR